MKVRVSLCDTLLAPQFGSFLELGGGGGGKVSE